MSCLISSQGLVLAATVVVSTTAFFLAFSRQKSCPPPEVSENTDTDQKPNGSCLCTEEKRRERQEKKRKKKVRFADQVKEPNRNFGEFKLQKGYKSKQASRICRDDIPAGTENHQMPANRIALYNAILRDRVHRIECSY